MGRAELGGHPCTIKAGSQALVRPNWPCIIRGHSPCPMAKGRFRHTRAWHMAQMSRDQSKKSGTKLWQVQTSPASSRQGPSSRQSHFPTTPAPAPYTGELGPGVRGSWGTLPAQLGRGQGGRQGAAGHEGEAPAGMEDGGGWLWLGRVRGISTPRLLNATKQRQGQPQLDPQPWETLIFHDKKNKN